MGFNPSGITEEDKEEIDKILASLIDDIEEMRDATWDSGKYALSVTKDSDIITRYTRGLADGFLEGPTVTEFELELPNGRWCISYEER